MQREYELQGGEGQCIPSLFFPEIEEEIRSGVAMYWSIALALGPEYHRVVASDQVWRVLDAFKTWKPAADIILECSTPSLSAEAGYSPGGFPHGFTPNHGRLGFPSGHRWMDVDNMNSDESTLSPKVADGPESLSLISPSSRIAR